MCYYFVSIHVAHLATRLTTLEMNRSEIQALVQTFITNGLDYYKYR